MPPEYPAAQLAQIVSQIYELVGDERIPDNERQTLLLIAHDLRGDLVTLVEMRFDTNAAAYQDFISRLNNLTLALDQAGQDTGMISKVVKRSEGLGKSIDELIKVGGTNSTGPRFK